VSGALAVLVFHGADVQWIPILVTLAVLFALPEIVTNNRTRRIWQFVTTLICILVIVAHALWPRNQIESIYDERIKLTDANDPNFGKSFITVIFRGPGAPGCLQHNIENLPQVYWNMLNCFVFQQSDGTFRVVWVFDHPLQYSGVRLERKNGSKLDTLFYRLGEQHNRILTEIDIDKALVDKESQVIIRAVQD